MSARYNRARDAYTFALQQQGTLASSSDDEIARLKADYDHAATEHAAVTSGGAQQGSVKWEELTARYNRARDAYNFGLQERANRLQTEGLGTKTSSGDDGPLQGSRRHRGFFGLRWRQLPKDL